MVIENSLGLKHFLLSFSFVFIGLWVPCNAAEVGNFDKGIEAYNKGDHETAINELEPLAQKGNVKAQFSLARIYSARKVSSDDQKKAINWYTKAAEQKHTISQYILGQIYAQEKNIAKDYAMSYAWYNLALSQGNETARKGRDIVMKKMTPKQVSEGQVFYKQIYKKIYGGK